MQHCYCLRYTGRTNHEDTDGFTAKQGCRRRPRANETSFFHKQNWLPRPRYPVCWTGSCRSYYINNTRTQRSILSHWTTNVRKLSNVFSLVFRNLQMIALVWSRGLQITESFLELSRKTICNLCIPWENRLYHDLYFCCQRKMNTTS